MSRDTPDNFDGSLPEGESGQPPAQEGAYQRALEDVNQLEKQAKALRDSEERLRLALDAGGMGLWDWNPRSNQAVWDRREFELFGLPVAAGPVDTDLFFQRVHEEDRPRLRRAIADVLNTGTDFHEEFRIRLGDGEIRWLAGIGRLYRDESGEPQRIVGVNFDITARKQADAQLRALNDTLEHQVRERTSALAMLRDIASMANRAKDVEEALEYCLRRVAEHNGWSFGHAYLPSAADGDLLLPAYAGYTADDERFLAFREETLRTPIRRGQDLPGRVFDSGRPEWSTDLCAAMPARRWEVAEGLGLTTTAAFPVMVENRIVGILEFFAEKPLEPHLEMLESMASVGTQLGRVIERKAFQNRLLMVSEEEHRRIGQELHDDVGQELTGLGLKAETLAEILSDDDGPAGTLARQVVAALDRTRRKTQALSRGLVPAEVDSPGLEAALEGLAVWINEDGRTHCRFHSRGDGRVADHTIATQLYRIAQEAVTNAVRHSDAERIEILLSIDGETTALEVRDNGQGLPADPRQAGMGMRIMQYRARLIGGELRVESAPNDGTRVICRLGKDRT